MQAEKREKQTAINNSEEKTKLPKIEKEDNVQ